MKYIPKALIYSRLALGILILIFSVIHINHYNTIAVVLFSIGLLTDIFDGIIARQLKISTQHLRRLDSAIDQLFFLMVSVATFIECPLFFYTNHVKLIVLLSLEAFTYLICYLKFRKEVATHAIASKVWVLFLFAMLIQVILTCNSTILFNLSFYIGIITRLEIIGIILTLRTWTNDVPSLYHAFLLRRGNNIKRNKLFNG